MRPDRLLAGAVLALVCFGLVMVFSASGATSLLDDGSPLGVVGRQAVYAAVGLGIYLVVVRLRPAAMREVAGPAVGLSLILLMAVLVVGQRINGARRWIDIGPLQIQPSELAKLALVLWVAALVARLGGRLTDARELRPAVILTAAFAVLILLEPDLGTAVVLLITVLVMLLVGGARPRHIGVIAACACAVGAIAIAFEPYRRARLFAFLDPWHDSSGGGFQIVQAKLALGSGGIHGVGLGDGVQKIFYLPEAHTDMIAATVGEELGLLGVLGIMIAFALVAAAGYRIALRARDLHQQVLAAGLTTMIVVQAAVNLGAVLGVLPVTGVPLPFVSFGGSSLLVFLASAGLLVNIGRRSAAARPGLRVVPGGAEGGDRRGRDRRSRHAGARAG